MLRFVYIDILIEKVVKEVQKFKNHVTVSGLETLVPFCSKVRIIRASKLFDVVILSTGMVKPTMSSVSRKVAKS